MDLFFKKTCASISRARSWDLGILVFVLVVGLGLGAGQWVKMRVDADRYPASIRETVPSELGSVLELGCLDEPGHVAKVWRIGDHIRSVRIVGRFCTGSVVGSVPEMTVTHLESRKVLPLFVRLRNRSFVTGLVALEANKSTFEATWTDSSGRTQKVTAHATY